MPIFEEEFIPVLHQSSNSVVNPGLSVFSFGCFMGDKLVYSCFLFVCYVIPQLVYRDGNVEW